MINKYDHLSKEELIRILEIRDMEAEEKSKNIAKPQKSQDISDDDNKEPKLKSAINKILNNRKFNLFMVLLIILNAIAFVLHTDVNFNKEYGRYLYKIEIASIIIFTIEYVMRVIAIKKFKELFSFYMIIDLLAIAPFYLSFFTSNAGVLRTLRLFRIIRIFKLARYSVAIKNIGAALKKRKHELMITGALFALAVFISSTLIYFAEKNTGAESFSSIISSFWWSIITFTTVGYGDTYPITPFGKIIASLSAIVGIAIHGLIIGVLGSAFYEIFKKEENDID